MKNVYSLFVALLFTFISYNASSQITQDSTTVVKSADSLMINKNVIVYMIDGDEFRGVYIEKTDKNLIIRTNNGELRLLNTKIESVILDEYKGKYKFPNPHDTRYFFGPSAIPIKKGVGYYQNIMVVGNFINYGITRNFSIGGGFEFISTLIVRQPIYFITPKVGFKLGEKFHLGGGVLVAGISGNNSVLGYGVATYGTSESNITLGGGFGLTNGITNERPTFMLSGQTRVSNGVSLMTENYFIEDLRINSIGVRLIGKNNAFDIGIVNTSGMDFIGIPYIGYVRSFGREKPRK